MAATTTVKLPLSQRVIIQEAHTILSNGVTEGACGPDPTGSIYKGAIQQITNYLNSGHLTDNTQINPEVTAC